MIGLSTLALLCWLVMFLAGTDIWHVAGRPGFWGRSGPPYADLRAFAYAFYGQFFILLMMLGVALWTTRKAI